MSRVEEIYKPALIGKKLPVLTLDNKWHKLFTQAETNSSIMKLEKELNELLKRQGKINTEVKEIHKLKAKLMDEIVTMMPENGMTPDKKTAHKLEENKRLINECNEKLEAYQEELFDIPKDIDKVNYELMLQTMEVCYDKIHENTKEIDEIAQWINQIRIELKKNVIRKQEKEINNQMLYSYMHDIFGADVIEIFDMTYNPDDKKIKHAMPKEEIKKDKAEE
jgi:hypothetical protein